MIPIAKEFQSVFVIGTLMLIGMQFILGIYTILLWLIWLVFTFFIRDFHRDIPPIPLAAISPIDGEIVSIGTRQNPYLEKACCCYTIQQNNLGEFNMHSPAEGKLEQLWVRYPNSDVKALSFWINTDEGDEVVVHIELNSRWQHAGTALHPGERVGQGRRCGFTAVGCKVHVYLPENVQTIAQIGDKVVAGKNILAHFVH